MSTEWDGDPAEDRDAEFYVEQDAADRAAWGERRAHCTRSAYAGR